MFGDQGLELADELRVLPEYELGLDARLERDQAQLVEPRRLDLCERLVRDVVERRPAPERERVARQSRGLLWVVGFENALGLRQPSLEALDVELAFVDGEDIAAAARHQQVAVRVQRLAELRHIDLDALCGGRRRVLCPDLVDQPFGRDNLVGVDQEVSQKRCALTGTDVGRAVIGENLEWAEEAEVHVLLRRP
jgi:hypothetical protein